MKKLCLMITVIFTTMLLAACGEMTQQDVINKLASNLEGANTYLATGRMEIESEGQKYQYFVEVGFKQDKYFRVTMRNETTNNEQIILKNDDGVFVLTPALNKQFKFQSEWPLSSSQVYLYQSLLADIMNDSEAVFTSTEETYVFETVANYHGNRDLVKQIVSFCKKTLAPVSVEVLDSAGEARMTMHFDSFEFNYEIAEGFFDSNLTMEETQNTMGDGVLETVNLLEAGLYPTFIPEGTTLTDKTSISRDNGDRIIMTFTGDQVFTLIQENASVRETTTPELVSGEIVFINGSVGTLGENNISWVNNGVEFFLVSETLETEDLISVASSIGDVVSK